MCVLNFCQKNNNIEQTLMVYKVPPGDIFANNYGREHMKPSHQVSYDMRLPHNRKIPVRNDQYIQGTPWVLAMKLSKYYLIDCLLFY